MLIAVIVTLVRAEQSRGRGKRVLAAASIPELLAASPGDAEFPDPR